jgi:hypothetical protein
MGKPGFNTHDACMQTKFSAFDSPSSLCSASAGALASGMADAGAAAVPTIDCRSAAAFPHPLRLCPPASLCALLEGAKLAGTLLLSVTPHAAPAAGQPVAVCSTCLQPTHRPAALAGVFFKVTGTNRIATVCVYIPLKAVPMAAARSPSSRTPR